MRGVILEKSFLQLFYKRTKNWKKVIKKYVLDAYL